MRLLSALRPLVRRKPDVPPRRQGTLTACDLADTASLTRPFVRDPFQRLRPPFSKKAVQLSAELAATAYSLDLDAWKAAGWRDFSILIDDELQSGMGTGVGSRFKILRAKAAMKELNPISQLAGALRQRERSDTIKAVCMMRPDSEGRYVLAIGFMGTGSRFYDWFSNFRFTHENGFHRGFYQLCESFEMNADEIVFPAAAAALGLEKLTLSNVFHELRSLSGRFRLWMAGHSQGGAVMQVLAHRLMHHYGVPAQNMVGYGFASPTVATGRLVYDPAAYPLYHILNADDPVPRMGALLHLGLCAEYRPDDAFRNACYQWSEKPESVALRHAYQFVQDGLRDMPSALMTLCALLTALAQEKGAEGMNELLTSWWAVPAVDKVLWRAGDRAMDALDKILASAQETYLALTETPMDEYRLALLTQKLCPLIRETPLFKLGDVISELGAAPHRMEEVYAAIASSKTHELQPFIWLKASAGMPARRYGSFADAGLWPVIDSPVYAARRKVRAHQMQGKMRVTHTAARNR